MVPGNAEVVAALEAFLAKARAGTTGYIALLAGEESGTFSAYSGGTPPLMQRAPEALGKLKTMVEAAVLNRTLPDRVPCGADLVCYNLAVAPVSFDFLHWLVDAEMTRVREGAPAPLKVAFWRGRDGKTGLSTPGRLRFFERVMIPLVLMIGAELTDDTGGRFKEFYGARDITAAFRAGEAVPRLRAGVELSDRDYVTITLRENPLWPHRNSNLAAWLEFGTYLQWRGERVVYVRETDKAHEPFASMQTCPEAALDLNVRAALYQNAKINLFMANGPYGLCMFMDRPWLAFSAPNPDGVPYAPNTPEFWRENVGMEWGGQYAWSRPDQRIVWESDTFENLVAAWEARP